MRVRSSCSARTGASPRVSTRTRGPCGPCNERSVSGRSATIRSVGIRWPAKPRPEVTPSRRFRRSSGTHRPRAHISTPTSGSVPSSDWWPISSPPRHLTSTSGQRAETARQCECCNNLKPQPICRRPIRKGATRHGTPLLEVRLPHDELARRLAMCAHIRCVHHDRLCLDFEPKLDGRLIQPLLLCATRFGAMRSPSGSLLTPRMSFWTHWRSFDRHVPCAVVVSLDLKVSSYRGFA